MSLINLLSRLLQHMSVTPRVVHYLCGTEALPTPFTAEEEADALARFAAGDNEARDTLVERNLRLVVFLSKKYESTGIDMEDIVSVGTIGLIKAINSFKPEKQIKLATYASRCIENEILMNIRANKRYQNTVYLQNTIGVDNDGNEFTLMDVLAAGEDSVFKQAETSILRTSLLKLVHTRLTEREQKIILMRYGIEEGATPLTQLQTARKLGISRSYVSRIETRALEKLREAMQEGE